MLFWPFALIVDLKLWTNISSYCAVAWDGFTGCCAQADLEDPYLNPWLWEATSTRYWGEGVLLPIAAAIGVIINSFLLG